MKILFIDHGQYITVGVTKLIEMAEAMAAAGHRVHIALTSRVRLLRMDRLEKNGVTFFRFPSLMAGRFRHGADPYEALRRMLYFRTRFDYDLIHARDSRPTVILPALYLKRRFHVPMVLEWADYFSGGGTMSERSGRLYRATLGRVEEFFEKGFRLKADGARVVSSFLRDRLLDMGFKAENILLNPNGGIVDAARLRPKQECRRRLGLAADRTYAGYLGHVYPRDHALFVGAFLQVAARRPELDLLFIGDVPAALRLSHPRVHYTGWVTDEAYVDYSNAVDFFALPMVENLANWARWPSKMGDYLACAKPVLSTHVSDFERIFATTDIGLLCHDREESLAEGLARMADLRDRWDAWGSNAFAYAREHLDWRIVAGELLRFYERLVRHS